jgi:hypothetical protein
MPEINEESDRRIHERVELERMMFLRVGKEIFMGLLKDVSNSGAKFVFDAGTKTEGRITAGADGLIVVDGIGEVPGIVARYDDNAAVFTFDLSEHEQEEVVAHIMIAQNEIDIRPEK